MVWVLAIIRASLINEIYIIAHDLEPSDSLPVVLILSDFCKRVRHDCDHHVQEDDRDEEGCQAEEKVAQDEV